MKTPGSIEQERIQEARLKHWYERMMELEGPMDEVQRLADMAMQWWDMHIEKHDGTPLGRPGVHFSEREIELVSFAFGEVWRRLKVINALLDRPFTGDAA
ncbi:hypothetical protein [Methylobacterium oryzae]|uniref:hypothetical protein n=1 Tax=Methylobacterium oryzae TaxID=334852 RepID=UPI001F3C7977|nr:hypothetical protein [Methylobacterium oryzae]UIN36298.1 hypothetical protein LXM90_07300 [Methylobacterium oryzae]